MAVDAAGPTREEYREALAECALVERIYHFDEIGSTSDFAKELINSSGGAAALHGTIVISNHQTAGRGRFDRRWLAPPGTALLFSIIVSPSALRSGRCDAPCEFLKTATTVAVCEGVRGLALLDARIKFPNDILVAEKKVAGLLLETIRLGGNELIVVGVGVNVNQRELDLPADTRIPATSIAVELGREFPLPELLRVIMIELDRWYSMEDATAATRRMNALCDTVGRFVEVDTGDGTCCGLAIGISDDGALIIRTEAGTQHAIYSGDIKQLAAAR